MNTKLISVVIPCYNEEINAPLMHQELSLVCEALAHKYDFEFIFVNDGSKDATWLRISECATADPRVHGISFSRNFGHQNALEAGLLAARGAAVISIDADFEQPPALITRLIERWEGGYHVVNTRRVYNDELEWSGFKRITSKAFYSLMNAISDVPVERGGCDFRLLDRAVVDTLTTIKEADRFYRGLVNWVGFKNTVVEYEPAKRRNGVTNYTLAKMVSLAWAGITSFSTVPMKGIILLGAATAAAAGLLLLFMGWVRFFMGSHYFSEMAFLVVSIIAMNGITMIALGVIAMYILRIHKEVQGRPNYIVQKTINL
jgi:dolichol-phosphate mannosyltransferase